MVQVYLILGSLLIIASFAAFGMFLKHREKMSLDNNEGETK